MDVSQQQFLRDLEFEPGANPTTSELKARWKDLCHKWHPDKGGDSLKFQRVTHAYKMLTDPEYRHKEEMAEIRKGKPNAKGDLNIRIVLPVSFEDAFFGRRVSISYNILEYDDNQKVVPLIGNAENALVTHQITIHLKAGMMSGYETLAQGKGHRRREEFGNAIIAVMPLPHHKFRVEGADVVSTEKLPLDLMLKGGKVDVPTLYGVKQARVKAGTKPGDSLLIRNGGVNRMGDHRVVVEPIYPTADDLKGESWKGLKIDWATEQAQDTEAEALEQIFNQMRSHNVVFRINI